MISHCKATLPPSYHLRHLDSKQFKGCGGPEKEKYIPLVLILMVCHIQASLPYVCKQTWGWTSFLLFLTRNSAPSVAGFWVQVGDFPVNVSQLAADLQRSARAQCREFGWVIICICMLFCKTGHHLWSVTCPSVCVCAILRLCGGSGFAWAEKKKEHLIPNRGVNDIHVVNCFVWLQPKSETNVESSLNSVKLCSGCISIFFFFSSQVIMITPGERKHSLVAPCFSV